MSCACSGCSAPGCSAKCGDTSRFTQLTAACMPNTLARKLIPTADSIRNLFTKFGLRPYIVRILQSRWTGPTRGDGVEILATPLTLLPTPMVADLSTLTEIVNPVGLDEIGSVLLSEISGCFTEEDLRGLNRDGDPLDPNVQMFYEIEFPRPDGLEGGVKRRFLPRSAPMYFASRFQWQVRLEKSHEDRTRFGELR